MSGLEVVGIVAAIIGASQALLATSKTGGNAKQRARLRKNNESKNLWHLARGLSRANMTVTSLAMGRDLRLEMVRPQVRVLDTGVHILSLVIFKQTYVGTDYLRSS